MGSVSGNNNPTSLADLSRQIEYIRGTKATVGGKPGFFISTQRANRITEVFDNLTTAQSNPAEVMSLENDIRELQQAALASEQRCKAAENLLGETQLNFKKLRAESENKDEERARFAARWKERERHLLDTVQAHQTELAEIKKLKQQPENVYDPESASELATREQKAQLELKNAKEELQAAKKEKADLTSECQRLHNEVNKANTAKMAAASDVSTLKSVLAIDTIDALPPVKSDDFVVNSALLKGILGEKGLKWLQAADVANKENMRERAYNLLLACRSSSSPQIVGISKLLQIAFDWIKTQSYKTRAAIKPWIDLIQVDLTKMELKSLKFYREKLEHIVGEIKRKASAAATTAKEKSREYQERYSWFATLCAAPYVFYHRAVRRTTKFITSVKAWFSGLFQSVSKNVSERSKGKAHEVPIEQFDSETLFDAEKVEDKPKVGKLKPSQLSGLAARLPQGIKK